MMKLPRHDSGHSCFALSNSDFLGRRREGGGELGAVSSPLREEQVFWPFCLRQAGEVKRQRNRAGSVEGKR